MIKTIKIIKLLSILLIFTFISLDAKASKIKTSQITGQNTSDSYAKEMKDPDIGLIGEEVSEKIVKKVDTTAINPFPSDCKKSGGTPLDVSSAGGVIDYTETICSFKEGYSCSSRDFYSGYCKQDPSFSAESMIDFTRYAMNYLVNNYKNPGEIKSVSVQRRRHFFNG